MISALVSSLPENPPTGGGWGDLLTTQVIYIALGIPFVIGYLLIGRKRKPSRRDEYDSWRERSGGMHLD